MKKSVLIPLRDRVVIKPMDPEDISPGGIIIPPTAHEKSQRGEVVAVGTGGFTDSGAIIKPMVMPGDKVLFTKYAGAEIKDVDSNLIIMREADILAII